MRHAGELLTGHRTSDIPGAVRSAQRKKRFVLRNNETHHIPYPIGISDLRLRLAPGPSCLAAPSHVFLQASGRTPHGTTRRA